MPDKSHSRVFDTLLLPTFNRPRSGRPETLRRTVSVTTGQVMPAGLIHDPCRHEAAAAAGERGATRSRGHHFHSQEKPCHESVNGGGKVGHVGGLSVNTPVAAAVYRRMSAAASSTCRNCLMLGPARASIQYSNARGGALRYDGRLFSLYRSLLILQRRFNAPLRESFVAQGLMGQFPDVHLRRKWASGTGRILNASL